MLRGRLGRDLFECKRLEVPACGALGFTESSGKGRPCLRLRRFRGFELRGDKEICAADLHASSLRDCG